MAKSVDPTQFAVSFLPLVQRFVGNQPDALAQMRVQVETELAGAKEGVARAEAQLAAIDQLQDLINDAANGQMALPTRPTTAPPLRKAILQVLQERRGYWTRDELYAELVRRGWGPGGKTPRNTFTSRLSELISGKNAPVERIGDGVGIPEVEEVPAM